MNEKKKMEEEQNRKVVTNDLLSEIMVPLSLPVQASRPVCELNPSVFLEGPIFKIRMHGKSDKGAFPSSTIMLFDLHISSVWADKTSAWKEILCFLIWSDWILICLNYNYDFSGYSRLDCRVNCILGNDLHILPISFLR